MTEHQKLAAQIAAQLIGGTISPNQKPTGQCSNPLMDAYVQTYHSVHAFLLRLENKKD